MKTARNSLSLRSCGSWIAATLACIAGCQATQPGARPLLRAIDDCESIEPWLADDDASASRLPGTDELRLSAAVNETVAFQLLLMPAGFTLGSFQLEFEPLTGETTAIGETAWRVYAMEMVTPTDPPAWMLRRWPQPLRRAAYADRLRPLDLLPRLPADRPQAIWIELLVPFGTPPGQYNGRLTLRRGSGLAAALPIQLRVHPFALPTDALPLCLAPLRISGLSADDTRAPGDVADLGRRITAAAAILRRHHLEPWPCDLFPILRVDPQQRVSVDWSAYDALAAPLLDGTAYDDPAPARCWPLPIDAAHPDPQRFGGADSPVYADVFSQYVTQCLAHFRQRGWEQAAVLLLETGPLSDAAAYERYQHLAALTRQAAPRLRIVAPFSPLDLREFGWPTYRPFPAPDLVDIWSPPAQFHTASPSAPARARLADVARTWLVPGEPPYSGSLRLIAPPLDPRTIAWQAYTSGAGGIRLLPLTPQPAPDRVALTPAARVQDPLIYATNDGDLMPSVRLKRLRRGLLDAACLDLLGRHGRRELADQFARTLFKFGGAEAYGDHFADGRPFGWVEEPAMWTLAHEMLAEQIARAMGGNAGAPPEDAAWLHSLDWDRLQAECRRVRLFVDGVRLSLTPGAVQSEVTATVSVTIANETRNALSATLACDEGNVAGARISAAQRAAAVPPEGRVYLRLPVALGGLPATDRGSLDLPLRLDGARTGRLDAAATLAYVVPVRLEQPLRLDGDLGDWPVASGNTAADFRLISGRPTGDGDLAADRPTQTTRAYFAFDDHHLYVGVRCNEPQMDRLPVGLSNFVRYDGLTPVGEDFIEIVLDPTNAGTRDSGEVYHLLIKANGVVTSERGIGCDPPTGRHAPWPSDVSVQVKHLSDAWSAEVKLPLASLPPETHAQAVWALNVARYSALRLEYSNWAGAKRHIYSPLSMGNLVWSAGAPIGPR